MAKKTPALEDAFMRFSIKYFGQVGSPGFNYFWLQISSDGNTSAMRAAEKERIPIVQTIFEGIRRVYGSDEGLQTLLLYKDKHQRTLLLNTIQDKQHALIKEILLLAIDINQNSNPNFLQNFLLQSDTLQTSPLLQAVNNNDRKSINYLFLTSDKELSIKMLQHQDSFGNTAFMRACESGYVKILQLLFTRILIDNYNGRTHNMKAIVELLNRENLGGHTAFELAIQNRHFPVLDLFLDYVYFLSLNKNRRIWHVLSYPDRPGNFLTALYKAEQELDTLLITGDRAATAEEKELSKFRWKLSEELLLRGYPGPKKKPEWRAITPITRADRILSFLGVFCGPKPRVEFRGRRSLTEASFCEVIAEEFIAELNQDNLITRRKEDFINILSLITKEKRNVFLEINKIRNNEKISQPEQVLLNEFNDAIDVYYNRHGQPILSEIQKNTFVDLTHFVFEQSDYLLVDDGRKFLLLNREMLFCSSLLNPIHPLPLNPQLSTEELKNWLNLYFSPHYTLHPFNKEILYNLPTVLSNLEEAPIFSDQQHSFIPILQTLFLLDGKIIPTSTLLATDQGQFFILYRERLSFRAENFHTIWLSANSKTRGVLLLLLAYYKYPIAQYEGISADANLYLDNYGKNIIHLLNKYGEDIPPQLLFYNAVKTYKPFLLSDSALPSEERHEIINFIDHWKEPIKTIQSESNVKAIAQLIVFFFPSAVRSLVNQDPQELVFLSSIMVADGILHQLLNNLLKHPQLTQILTTSLANKLEEIVKLTGRLPVIGTFLSIYGLVGSTNALINCDPNDPNRPYYAHLLINNLVNFSLMGIAASLPFWPTLGLFAVLTYDQLLTEGKQLHDISFYLQDDIEHPLLRLYHQLLLGLGIIPETISLTLEQRYFYQALLNYIERFEGAEPKTFFKFIMLSIPPLKRISVKTRVIEYQGKLVCPRGYSPPRAWDRSWCFGSILEVDLNNHYSFELGKNNTYCEKRDVFSHNNRLYDLFIGTQSEDCTLGIHTTKPGITKAHNPAGSFPAAAVLVHKHLNNYTSVDTNLLLLIDVPTVRSYQVKLFPTGASFNSAIKKIVAIYGNFLNTHFSYLTASEVKINQEMLVDNTENLKTIEHFIIFNQDITVIGNSIPEKSFVFFINSIVKIENNVLYWGRNAQAHLNSTKKLILSLNKVTVHGAVDLNSNQTIIIDHLKGSSINNKAIFDSQRYKNFLVNLGKHSTYISDKYVFVIEKGLNHPILQVYMNNSLQPAFHYILFPLNKLELAPRLFSHQTQLIINEGDEDILQEPPKLYINTMSQNLMVNFYGNYSWHNQDYFSRIAVSKAGNKWQHELEIELNSGNNTQFISLQIKRFILNSEVFQRQNFDKITLLFRPQKLIHMVFIKEEKDTNLMDHYMAYRFESGKENQILILTHDSKHWPEETYLILKESTEQITINSIIYQIKLGSTLLAISSIANMTIDAKKLLDKIYIPTPLLETSISLENNTLHIGSLKIKNLASDTFVYFAEQIIPLSYVIYLAKDATREITLTTHSELIGDFQIKSNQVENNPVVIQGRNYIPNQKASNSNSWLKSLGGSLSIIAAIALGAGFYYFIKRFRRGRAIQLQREQNAQIAAVGAVGMSLLAPTVEAGAQKNPRFEPETNTCANSLSLFEDFTPNIPYIETNKTVTPKYDYNNLGNFYLFKFLFSFLGKHAMVERMNHAERVLSCHDHFIQQKSTDQIAQTLKAALNKYAANDQSINQNRHKVNFTVNLSGEKANSSNQCKHASFFQLRPQLTSSYLASNMLLAEKSSSNSTPLELTKCA